MLGSAYFTYFTKQEKEKMQASHMWKKGWDFSAADTVPLNYEQRFGEKPWSHWTMAKFHCYHLIWLNYCGVSGNKLEKPRVSEKQSLSCTLVLLLFMPKAWAWIENTALGRLFGIPEGKRAGLQCHYLPRNNIHTYACNKYVICLETHFRKFSRKIWQSYGIKF